MTPVPVTLLVALTMASTDPINAVIGDESWLARNQAGPTADTRQVDRIRVHLEYVETRLRERDVRGLTETQRHRRSRLLDILGDYRRRGIFPRRTNDPYVGKRPRFIDDRGVHCAVGHLIAKSGRPKLAAQINRQFEYAYVADISVPQLNEWADAAGFTRKELATIQPGYSPVPTASSTRRALRASAPSITVACAPSHSPTLQIRLHVEGTRSGHAVVTSRQGDPFTKCFVERANRVETGGGAYDGPTNIYRFDETIVVPSPQKIFESRFERLRLDSYDTKCLPRPGPIPVRADYDIRVGKDGVTADVRTQPSNTETDVCLVEQMKQKFSDFGPGRWRLRTGGTRWMNRRVRTQFLEGVLPQYAKSAATSCLDEDAPGFDIDVHVFAKQDDETFTIHAKPGTDAFLSCFEGRLAKHLRGHFSVGRKKADGTFERFFRIDDDVTAETSFEIETKRAVQERLDRHRREREREKDYAL